MARTSTKTKSSTPSSTDEGVDFSITNTFSEFLSNTADIKSSLNDEIKKIPSGIDLIDAITGGGIPCKFTVYMGKPGAGKSSLIVNYIKNAQKLWGQKAIIVYCDSEESMTQKRLKDFGCTLPVNIINGMTVEKLFKTLEAICLFKEKNPDLLDIPSILVWDSIANTMTEDVMQSEELSNTDGARRANVLARYLPKYVDKLVKYNIALVAVNQYRVKLAMGGGPVSADIRGMGQDKTAPGGQTVAFNAFQLFDVEQGPAFKNDPYGYPMSPIKVRAIKNKAFTPNIPVNICFNHHRGFSNFWTNFEFLKERKYIQAGAFCKLNSMPTQSFRQKQASLLYKENPEWRNAFNDDLQKALAEFIEENSGGDIEGIFWDPDYREEEKSPTTLAWFEKNKDKKSTPQNVENDSEESVDFENGTIEEKVDSFMGELDEVLFDA